MRKRENSYFKQREKRLPMRFLTLILVIALIVSTASTALWGYDTFMREPSFILGKNLSAKAMDKARIAQEREKMEEIEAEISAQGTYIGFANCNMSDIVVSGENDAMDAVVRLQNIFHFTDAESAFRLELSYPSSDGSTVYIFQQYYNNIEVYGHQLKMLVNQNGGVEYLDGECMEISHDFDTSVSYNQYDGIGAVQKYIKSTYGVNSDEITVEKDNTIIYFTEDGSPAVGYLYTVSDLLVLVDGNSNEVVSAHSTMMYDMITGTLRGHDNVSYYDEGNGNYILQDTDRNIYCYRAENEYYFLDIIKETDIEKTIQNGPYSFRDAENAEENIVVALKSLEQSYDYFRDMTSPIPNAGKRIVLIDNYIDKPSWNSYRISNAAFSFNFSNHDRAVIFIVPDTTVDQNTLAHEYTHSVVWEKTNLQAVPGVSGDEYQTTESFGVSEGLSDIFAELVEYNASSPHSCDWIYSSDNGSRNINKADNPQNEDSNSNLLYDYNELL